MVSQIVTDILEALFGALTKGTNAIANAIKTIFVDMLFETSGSGESLTYTLNPFGATMLIFGGVALVFSLTYLVYNLVRSKIG